MDFIAVFNAVRSGIKAQWVFSVVVGVTVFTAWLLIGESHDLEASAYKFAVVIIGALATKAVQAASVKAFPTMMLMAMCAMFLAAIALVFTDAEHFKDSAVEQMLLMLAGSLSLLIGELLSRFKPEG